MAVTQRCSKLRLLNATSALLLPDHLRGTEGRLLDLLCLLLRTAADPDRRLACEEQLCVLQLLAVVIARCATTLKERLSELLGYVAVLSGLHRSPAGVALVPTNLPHLQFFTAAQEGSKRGGGSSSSCTDTSGSEFSAAGGGNDQDFSEDGMAAAAAARQRRDEGRVEREALNCLTSIVRRCHKKDVVSFWYIFLPDRSFCPLRSGVADLLGHPAKKNRMAAIGILVEFLNHCQQFLALAQHQVDDNAYLFVL